MPLPQICRPFSQAESRTTKQRAVEITTGGRRGGSLDRVTRVCVCVWVRVRVCDGCLVVPLGVPLAKASLGVCQDMSKA